jgi:hypothetical protein
MRAITFPPAEFAVQLVGLLSLPPEILASFMEHIEWYEILVLRQVGFLLELVNSAPEKPSVVAFCATFRRRDLYGLRFSSGTTIPYFLARSSSRNPLIIAQRWTWKRPSLDLGNRISPWIWTTPRTGTKSSHQQAND